MDALIRAGKFPEAQKIQHAVNDVIYAMCACRGNLYAVMKKILEINEGLKLGSVRAPLPALAESDLPQVEKCAKMIRDAIAEYC